MSLSDGDPAIDGDIWFRIVTQDKHIRHGRVHHAAFGGNAIAKPKKDRPWEREVSGRLRSLAGSIDEIIEFAEAYCERMTARGGGTKKFHGVIFVKVSDAKTSSKDWMRTAVHYTENADDPAHADFVFVEWKIETQEDIERFNLWVPDLFQALHNTGQLQLLPEAEIE